MRRIAVAGNIGSGKTTLTGLLAKHYNCTPLYEPTEINPYLEDFYQDMRRWSFNLQIYFLQARLNQLLELKKADKDIVQDRTIYEDVYIFAENLYDMALISQRDYKTYLAMFKLANNYISPPDLLIYLRAEVKTLHKQIMQRGRAYENQIRIDYLQRLNNKYEAWISKYEDNLLIVDVDKLDFSNKEEDLQELIRQIDQKLEQNEGDRHNSI